MLEQDTQLSTPFHEGAFSNDRVQCQLTLVVRSFRGLLGEWNKLWMFLQ